MRAPNSRDQKSIGVNVFQFRSDRCAKFSAQDVKGRGQRMSKTSGPKMTRITRKHGLPFKRGLTYKLFIGNAHDVLQRKSGLSIKIQKVL